MVYSERFRSGGINPSRYTSAKYSWISHPCLQHNAVSASLSSPQSHSRGGPRQRRSRPQVRRRGHSPQTRPSGAASSASNAPGGEEVVGGGGGWRHGQPAVLQVGQVRLTPVLLQPQEGAARGVRVRRPADLWLWRRRSSAACRTKEGVAAGRLMVEDCRIVGGRSCDARNRIRLRGVDKNAMKQILCA